MGGRPLTALAIAGFPKDDLDADTIRLIFKGGFDKLREAGVALLGGHTVQDREIKFGYAVTGAIDPSRMLTNAGARPGDVVMLTKPIGTGVVGTAIKFERVTAEQAEPAIASMRALNRAAADVLRAMPAGTVHACTDITGFGLVGHATEMARASQVTIALDAARVPLFDGVLEMATANRSGGMASNEEHFRGGTRVRGDLNPSLQALLFDPQTSGGLLVAVDPHAAMEVAAALTSAGALAARIGAVEAAVPSVQIDVRP